MYTSGDTFARSTGVNTHPSLLEVDQVTVIYRHGRRTRDALGLRDVSLSVGHAETVGLVGESGSGKTTLGRAVLGQLQVTSGRIIYDGADITHANRRTRGALAREIQVVFQDPYSSLNPSRTVGQSVAESLITDSSLSKSEAARRVAETLERVGMPADAASRYPSQFSGGQRQRIAIARAIVCQPRLVICDEPVSGLDLSVQAQVLNLLLDLQCKSGLSLLFIGHDLAVVRHLSHRIAVMHAGEIVEEGPAERVYERPAHPYTQQLLAAVLTSDPEAQRASHEAGSAIR